MEQGNQKSLLADISAKGIIMLTLPISLARLIPELNFLINGIFLGHLGKKDLALASITGVYYLIFAVIGYGLGNASLSIISRLAGENKREGIINTLKHSYIISISIFLAGVICTYFLLKPLLLTVGINVHDTEKIYGFLKIRIWGLIFLLAYQLSNQYLICIQETKWLLVGSLVEALSNIILDYVLIFGGFGIKGFGFNGAAYASVLSEILGIVAIYFVIVYKKFSIVYDIPNTFRYSKSLLKKIFNQSYPIMAQYAISIIAWWIFYLLVSRNYDDNGEAASQTMRNLFGITGVFSWAFGATTNTIISNLIGQAKFELIPVALRRILTISMTGMFAMIILLNISPSKIFELYGQNDAEFIAIGTILMRVVTSALLLLTAAVIFLNALLATSKSKLVFFVELAAILTYLIYIYFVIEVKTLHVGYAWGSEWVYWMVIFTLSFIFFRRWYKKELVKN